MRLVDTSAWIEWLIGSPAGTAIAGDLPERGQWLVPTVVQLELAKWLTREAGEDKADRVIAFSDPGQSSACVSTARAPTQHRGNLTTVAVCFPNYAVLHSDDDKASR